MGITNYVTFVLLALYKSISCDKNFFLWMFQLGRSFILVP